MKGQIRKLRKEPEVLEEYNEVIKEQLTSGVIESITELERADKVHYIPHLAVVRKEASTTKVRVVCDASAKLGKGGTSLNDCLHVGPSLNPLLFYILVRFREKRVALVGDIEKAFLNIEVAERDRDCLRFLWCEDVHKPESKIVVYRFCRVVFGLNASPFLLNATLRYHISKYKDEDPEFARKMLEGFHVDDLVTGEKNLSAAFHLYETSKQRMAAGGFRLRKWMTNDKALRDRIERNESNATSARNEEEETFAKVTLGTGAKVSERCQKVLGLSWDCEKDCIEFSFKKLADRAREMKLTKRNLLSLLAGLFDPLGIISPMIVCMKILLQNLCCENRGWDEELEGNSSRNFHEWIADLSKIEGILISRCIYERPKQEVLECELHGFGDASSKAYCAVVYLVYKTNEGTSAKLLTLKSRVAPLKKVTIPHLELMPARILAQFMDTVKLALESQLKVNRVRYWLDSSTALCWIQNRGEWKQFVRQSERNLEVDEQRALGTLSWRRKPSGYQFARSPWIKTQRRQTVVVWTAVVNTGRGEVACNCRRHPHSRKRRRIEKDDQCYGCASSETAYSCEPCRHQSSWIVRETAQSDRMGVAFHQKCTSRSRPDSQKKGKTEKRRIGSGRR